MLTKPLLDTTRGRIVAQLQRGGLTVDELASALDLTANAVRSHLTAMARDGLVRRAGARRGTTRPPQVYEITAEIEQLLSRAYVPLLTELVQVVSTRLPAEQLEEMLRETGRALADELSGGRRPSGSLRSRVLLASQLLNEQLGALTSVEQNGHYLIRGVACPLSAVTGKHPGVCLAMESLVAEIVGTPVRECCDRDRRPRCCFEIGDGKR